MLVLPGIKNGGRRISSSTLNPATLRQIRNSQRIDIMDSHGELLSNLRQPVDRNNLTYLAAKQLSRRDPTIKLIDLGISSLSQEAIELLLPVERLSLQKNALTTLPNSFDKLTKLRYLDLHSNKLQEIPPILLRCPHLEILDLSSNHITHLPQEYPQLWCENLKVLSLKNNAVSSLRELYQAVMSLKSLKILEIEGNSIPLEELEQVKSQIPPQSLPGTITPEEYWCVALRKYFEPKISRAAKRMGFINVSEEENHQEELYNHKKYNDYFKRLSVLPEETTSQRVTHDELAIACRKLLFSFTECQQNVRKITSFCEDKQAAVNSVSLLYSVRSHIDNLVELLEQNESPNSTRNDVMVKLCVTIIAIFKQIFSLLRKNFNSFFQANEIYFARMFYVNLLCSYTEMYNAWNLISPQGATASRKRKTSRTFSQSVSHGYKHVGTRTRSNTLQRSTSNAMPQANSPTPISANFSSAPGSVNSTPPPSQGGVPLDGRAVDGSPKQRPDHLQHSPLVIRRPPDSVSQPLSTHSPGSGGSGAEDGSPHDMDIDAQLYRTLNTVIAMVNVVYSKLTSAITKSAIASTKSGELSNITSTIAAKIKDLTDTCYQSMELSKVLKERLALIAKNDSDIFSVGKEKAKTWEDINAFLKSIISILANTKIIMKDLPILNEVRPNLASLAKITKDVTVILDLSSFRNISQAQQQQDPQQKQHQQSQQPQSQPQGAAEETHTVPLVTPLSTPSLVTVHAPNPFEQF